MTPAMGPHGEVCDFEHFEEFVGDRRVPILYSAAVGYGIPRVASESAEDWWESPDLVAVTFCPWCGRKL